GPGRERRDGCCTALVIAAVLLARPTEDLAGRGGARPRRCPGGGRRAPGTAPAPHPGRTPGQLPWRHRSCGTAAAGAGKGRRRAFSPRGTKKGPKNAKIAASASVGETGDS